MVNSVLLEILDQFVEPIEEDPNSLIPTFITTTFAIKNDNGEQERYPTRDDYFRALKIASGVPRSAMLQTFNSFHMKCASALVDIFYEIDLKKLANAVRFAKTQVNLDLVIYALSVALPHRKDVAGETILIPSHVYTTPKKYVDMGRANEQFHKEKRRRIRLGETGSNDPIYIDIPMDFTATDKEPEHRIAYFREDIALNLHHWHWHLVFPFSGKKEIIYKDRRGELFYYMHQQMMARYKWERLSNNLNVTEPYTDFRNTIKEAYFPKLDSAIKTKIWGSRPALVKPQDINRDMEPTYCRLFNMELWRDRIIDTIDRGYAFVKKDGKETVKKLVEPEAINDLGSTIEASELLSWNYDYYGNFHNSGHEVLAYCHDPDSRFKEEAGVMAYTEAAARDPIFYRWHTFIDNIFDRYKRTLDEYTYEERYFQGIEIKDIEVVSKDVPETNTFKTFWQRDLVDITHGISNRDPEKDGRVFAKFIHLQHKEFVYKINVNNTNSTSYTGTVRIFIAPKYDENRQPMLFNKQRRLFMELDKFTTVLKPGINTFERESTDSSITIPFEQSFITKEEAQKYLENPDSGKAAYCGCGWPQHLLIAKGYATGFCCQLFVMITNYEDDRVDQVEGDRQKKSCCIKPSVSFCGLRDKKYPDKRSMGFPFDRELKQHKVKARLEDFMTKSQIPDDNIGKEEPLSNMKVIDVKVKYVDETIDGPTIPTNK